MMASKRAKKTTQRQYEIMITFIENNKEMVSGKLTNKFTAQRRDELWEELSNILNADGLGPQKTAQKWRRTWIDIKSEAKTKAAERSKHFKKTGGGAPCEPLPPLIEKITSIIDPIMITGDCEVEETSRAVEEITINCDLEAIPAETLTPLTMEAAPMEEMPASASTSCAHGSSSHKRGPNRKVSAKDFVKMMSVESEKAEALRSIAAAINSSNALKEAEIVAYKERTQAFVNIANAFLTK